VTSKTPQPPTDLEKISYFGHQKRWPFVWLFVSQLCLLYSFAMVMRRSPDSALGLVLLTVMAPPVFVNLWLRVRKHRTVLADHETKVAAWRRQVAERHADAPGVDIMLPSCGEPLEVLENTFRHVAAIEWPGQVRVRVLDDAGLPAVRELAERHGFEYLCRPNRGEWKKAGNLIYGFDRSGGEFVVVFDADFAPRTDFLYETLPYMDDPRVGVVQTAQYFDVDGVNAFARYAGALQELFFRWIQPARDTYEAAICAGTNVVYRRAAVVAAGGFARVPMGEDVHSGMKIWVAHYRTRYVPLVLARGLAPDSWAALTNQQYRWCRSSMLLMISQFFKDAPFTKRQRLCFWAAFLYYMASAALLITSTLPTLVMVWFYPDKVYWWNYLPLIPAFLTTFLIFPRLARGWNIRIYRVCTINSVCHALAVTDALRQRVAAWVPTGAALRQQRPQRFTTPKRAALLLRTWIVIVQTLLWAGVARAVLHFPVQPWGYVPAAALGLLQLFMLAPFLVRLEPRPVAPASTRPVLAKAGA
jgi:cellulose synthase (UDP-forming)